MSDATELDAEADLALHWIDFCHCDRFDGIDTFAERMEAAGLIYLDEVEADDLDDPFASELGIEPGGKVWRLTDEGQRILWIRRRNQ